VAITIVILAVVITLIAVRQVGTLRLQIWHIMAAGAAAMLLTRSISLAHALEAIELDVILFLLGVFILGKALEDSGALADLSYRLFSRARSTSVLILLILFGGGIASALLMNDTIAIVGVPVVIALARAHRISPQLTLLALAFAATAGSLLSPIGNPQNLLIAISASDPSSAGSGIGNPFLTFAAWLAVPTLGALLLSYLALRLAYPRDFHATTLVHERSQVTNPQLARIARIALVLLVVLINLRILLVTLEADFDLPLTAIALIPAAVVLVASRQRLPIVRGIDWPTLAFFAALFIVVEAVDEAGLTAEVVTHLGDRVAATAVILAVSAVLSQVVSNVPLVALYLPSLAQSAGLSGVEPFMALAAGSTLAGNLTLIGAASNIIIVDNAERRFGERLSFWQFTRVGLPLGLAQLLLVWLWFALI